jgi:hypothetical protein
MTEDRATVLLRATLEILNKCDEGPYVKDVLGVTAEYDGAECDGYCLKEDIEHYLEFGDD